MSNRKLITLGLVFVTLVIFVMGVMNGHALADCMQHGKSQDYCVKKLNP